MFPKLTPLSKSKLTVGRRLRLASVMAVLLAASVVKPGAAQGAQEAAPLEAGKAIAHNLSAGEQHRYELKLAAGECADVVVEQRGIDVVVELHGPDGKLLIRSDDEYRSQGEERIEVVAEAAAVFGLIVKPSSQSAPPGGYQIRAAEVRAASERDRALYEARKLKPAFDRALADGKYDDARRLGERALAIGERVLGAEAPFVAGWLADLGNYYEDKQDFAKAIAMFERAVAICEKTLGAEHPRTARIIRVLAFAYYETNEVARAKELAERAAEIGQKTLGPEHPFVAQCLHTLALITGDATKREKLLEQALKVAEKSLGAEHPNVSLILNDLGVLYTERGEYQKAEQFLVRAQAIHDKTFGPENVSHVVSLFNLGRLARERKDYATAEANYQRAIAIVEKAFGPENPRLAFILNNLANVYRARGEYAKSLAAHLQVLRIAEATRGPYHPFTLLSLGNIAKTYAAQGNLTEAVKFQVRVDAVIERNIEMNLAIGSERQKLSYLNSLAERMDRTISLSADLAPDDPDASALAALVLLQRKGRVLDAMSDSLASLRQRATPEEQSLLKQFNDAAAQLARLVLNGPQNRSFDEHQKSVSQLEEQKDRLEAEISRRSAEFRAAQQPVALAAVQSAIPADAALIEFAVYRPFDPKAESNSEAYRAPRYIAYILRRQGQVRWHDLGDARAIDESIGALRQALGDPGNRDVRGHARALDEKVMRPLRALAGDATRLLISPDGLLNLVPFEALVDEQDRYLIQRYAFTYLTSGRDLLRLEVPRPAAHSPLVMADPLFGEPGLPQPAPYEGAHARRRESKTNADDLSSVYFAPLAGTAREAQVIKSLFPEAKTLLGEQATESSLKEAAAPRILHIATHGFFLTERPAGANLATTRAISASAKVANPLLRSGLALAGANLRRSTGDDGILTALEASGLNLWGTKLVVLSACDTGLGEVHNGEGVYGLRRALMLAGSESLLMSLWPVSDYVTHELMTDYYKGLQRGLGRGEALRQVQLATLKRRGREHPFYWAGFIQLGEWANLGGKR